MRFAFFLSLFIITSIPNGFAKFIYETIPYRFPMKIGDTYNANEGGSLIGLYAGSFYEVTSNTKQNVDLRAFGKDESTNQYLSAGGHLSLDLNVKAVGVGISVSGQYTKDDHDENKLAEWLGKVDLVKSKEVILDTLLNIRGDCQKLPKNLMGSHYVRSVGYGRNLDLRIKTKTASKSRSQVINAEIDLSVTVKGITPGVGASIDYEDSKMDTFVKTDISFVADGIIPFLPVSLKDASDFVNEWQRLNKNNIYPKTVELAVYDVKAVCKGDSIDVNKIPKTYNEPGDEVMLEVYRSVEDHIMDFRYTTTRLIKFVQAMDFQKITQAEEKFLREVFNFRWMVVENELAFRYYINTNINVEGRNKNALVVLKGAEDAYKNGLGNENSWEDYARFTFESNSDKASVFCPKMYSYYSNGCYYFSKMKATKVSAEAYCAEGASELLEIRYLDEFNFLKERLTNMSLADSSIKSQTFMLNAEAKDGKMLWKSKRTVNMKYVHDYEKSAGAAFSHYSCLVFRFVSNEWRLYPDFCKYFPEHNFICHRLFF